MKASVAKPVAVFVSSRSFTECDDNTALIGVKLDFTDWGQGALMFECIGEVEQMEIL